MEETAFIIKATARERLKEDLKKSKRAFKEMKWENLQYIRPVWAIFCIWDEEEAKKYSRAMNRQEEPDIHWYEPIIIYDK